MPVRVLVFYVLLAELLQLLLLLQSSSTTPLIKINETPTSSQLDGFNDSSGLTTTITEDEEEERDEEQELISAQATPEKSAQSEKSLINALLKNYSKFVRPVASSNETVQVHFNLKLNTILQVDEEIETAITVFCWMSQGWIDPSLSWSPEKYGDIQEIVLPVNEIWKPDTAIFNGWLAGEVMNDYSQPAAVVDHNGFVLWVSPRIFKIMCEHIDEFNYPSDGLKCFLKFGSWTAPGPKIDYVFTGNDKDFSMIDFTEHPQWKISRHWAARNEIMYECCPGVYVDLTYQLRLRRKNTLNCIKVFFFPLVALGFLIAVPFFMPANTVARVQMACMNFFMLFLYGLILLMSTSASAKSATANKFPQSVLNCFEWQVFNAIIAIVLNAWICEMRLKTHPPPKLVGQFFQALGFIILCRCCYPKSCNNYGNGSSSRRHRHSESVLSRIRQGESFAMGTSAISDCASSAEAEGERHATAEWRTVSDVFNTLACFAFVGSHLAVLAFTLPKSLIEAYWY